MNRHQRSNLISYTLFAASAAILAGVVYFALNIQVIKNWSLTLPSGDIHAGDTLVVASTYTKVRQVTGTSMRTIECESQKGIYVSYPLNHVMANRAPGTTGTGIIVTVPTELNGITKLPDTCHICVSLTYPVLPFRTVPYFRCTSDFNLLER